MIYIPKQSLKQLYVVYNFHCTFVYTLFCGLTYIILYYTDGCTVFFYFNILAFPLCILHCADVVLCSMSASLISVRVDTLLDSDSVPVLLLSLLSSPLSPLGAVSQTSIPPLVSENVSSCMKEVLTWTVFYSL